MMSFSYSYKAISDKYYFSGASVSPQYFPLLSVPVPQPINGIQMIADEIRVQAQDQHWNIVIYFAGQDKNVYKYNVGQYPYDIN